MSGKGNNIALFCVVCLFDATKSRKITNETSTKKKHIDHGGRKELEERLHQPEQQLQQREWPVSPTMLTGLKGPPLNFLVSRCFIISSLIKKKCSLV